MVARINLITDSENLYNCTNNKHSVWGCVVVFELREFDKYCDVLILNFS